MDITSTLAVSNNSSIGYPSVTPSKGNTTGNPAVHSAETREAMLETQAAFDGEKRYFAEDDLLRLRPGQKLLEQYVPLLADAIEKFIADEHDGRAGRKHTAVPYLVACDPLQSAWMTVATVIQSVGKAVVRSGGVAPRLQQVAEAVADAIEQHVNLTRLAKESGGLYRKVSDQLATSTSVRHRTGVWSHVVRKYSSTVLTWDKRVKFLVGSKLLELLEEATGFVSVFHSERRMGRDSALCVTLNDAAVDWITEADRACSLLRPSYLPMIVPPRQWTSVSDGGYLLQRLRTRLVIGLSLIHI